MRSPIALPRVSLAVALAAAVSWSAACSSSRGSAPSPDGSGDDVDSGTTFAADASHSGDAAVAADTGGHPTSGDSGSHSPDASSSGSPDGGSDATSATSIWSPSSAQPIHFHWQLSDTFTAADLLASQQGAVVYDIDGEGATAADVAAIHAAGASAVCYVDVGTLEQGRSDYSQFPASVVGPAVQGWPGENWLLVTAANQSVILPLMQARLTHWCQAKGFDAVEPDNLDAFGNISGVTETDNVAYDLAIAGQAHALSLSIGLKNLLPDVGSSNLSTLATTFDWALVEQCYEYTECDVYAQSGSFIALGKSVWDVEYNQSPSCSAASAAHMNAQKRDLDLVAPTSSGYTYTPCVPDSQGTW